MVGPSGLFSTVGDLVRWDVENFYTGEVGGPALLAQMQEKGKLNNGKEIGVAPLALKSVNTVGSRLVEHAPAAVPHIELISSGFRTNISRSWFSPTRGTT